jgi:hypothetical protein
MTESKVLPPTVRPASEEHSEFMAGSAARRLERGLIILAGFGSIAASAYALSAPMFGLYHNIALYIETMCRLAVLLH